MMKADSFLYEIAPEFLWTIVTVSAVILANIAISEIPPRSPASDGHVHGEAYIYFISGRGYSIVGEQRVEWGPGDAMYVPPETFHQHYVTSDEPAKYLRVIPSPLLMNLLAVMASVMPYLKPEAQK